MLKEERQMSNGSHAADSSSETAWTVVVAITGVVAAIVALSLAQALLAIGIVGLLWRFCLQGHPLSPSRRPQLLVVSMVLSIAGAALLIASAASLSTGPGSAIDRPATPGTVRPSSSPTGRLLAFKRAGSATITLPRRNEVPRCWKYRGDANLRADRNLVVGERRVDPADDYTYFDAVAWEGRVGKSKWSTNRRFGSVVGQTYRVFVVAITTKAEDEILAPHPYDSTWRTKTLPPASVADVVELPDVRQNAAPHNCDAP
jgi:hypothetical protein